MNKFLLKVFIFSVALFVFDKGFLLVRDELPKHDTLDNRLEKVFNSEINKDIILFGSSIGDTDLLPHMFEDSLGLETFNLSFGAAGVTFQKFVLQSLLKNNKAPKLIIKLVTNDSEFYGNSGVNDMNFRLDRLYPIIKYKGVRDELMIRENVNPILSKNMVLSHFKKQHVIDLIKPNYTFSKYFENYGTQKFNNRHDSLGNWEYIKNPIYDLSKENQEFLKDFVEFQKLCHDNNIKLIYAVTPTYKELNKEWIKLVEEHIEKGTFLYIYDVNEPAYKNRFNFADPLHMNPKGASVFTNEIIKHCFKVLNENN